MSEGQVTEGLKDVFSGDPLAAELGIEIVELVPGRSKVKMQLERKHQNFLGFVHGGAIFTLLDQAFALASNSHNLSSVAIDMSLHFIRAPSPHAVLFAEGREISRSRKLGLYELTVTDEDGELVCRSEGRVYRIGNPIVEAGEKE